LIAAACFAAPLAWIVMCVGSDPIAMVESSLDGYRIKLLLRTLGYDSAIAVVAVLIAVPAAAAIGRPRAWLARPLMVLLPIALLLPSIAFEYGWKQVLRLCGAFPSPQSAGDIARCVWTLAAWLWPIPAALGAWALRKTDQSILEQARLDGVLSRVTARILMRPMAIGLAIVLVIASQEFAVFEPSGISVVATEVRMVFETGAMSSSENPIAQTFGSGGAVDGSREQSVRAAAAVITAMPLTLCVLVVVAVAIVLARRMSFDHETLSAAPSSAVAAPGWMTIIAYAIIIFTSILPMLAMMVSLRRWSSVGFLWGEFGPQLIGSVTLAAMTSMIVVMIGVVQLGRQRRWAVGIAGLCFLLGGQMLAIGLIRIFNRDLTAWVYDTFVVAVVGYTSRFGWLALAGAMLAWQRPWMSLRDMAAVDGASHEQTLWRVVLPLAWPIVAASALLVGVLCLTEVPATMLLSPQNPQPLVPLLMTWVHMQRYDAMIEGTLLLCGVVATLSCGVVLMIWIARRSIRRIRGEQKNDLPA
jgi:ABC-type Fe3+ transport system permease subunit